MLRHAYGTPWICNAKPSHFVGHCVIARHGAWQRERTMWTRDVNPFHLARFPKGSFLFSRRCASNPPFLLRLFTKTESPFFPLSRVVDLKEEVCSRGTTSRRISITTRHGRMAIGVVANQSSRESSHETSDFCYVTNLSLRSFSFRTCSIPLFAFGTSRAFLVRCSSNIKRHPRGVNTRPRPPFDSFQRRRRGPAFAHQYTTVLTQSTYRTTGHHRRQSEIYRSVGATTRISSKFLRL